MKKKKLRRKKILFSIYFWSNFTILVSTKKVSIVNKTFKIILELG